MDGFMTYERVKTPRGDAFRTVGESLSADEIYVLDTETTGLQGAPRDLVVDVGICRVSLSEGTVDDVYSSVLGYETDEWDDYLREAWIFQNTDMTLEMVEEAPPALTVIDDVRRILRGKPVTAYNTGYDFGKFLYEEPWNMRGWFVECADIMVAATPVCKVPSEYYGRQYKFPKLDYAYAKIVDGDPAGIHGVQDHRALSDARMASHLMIAMSRNGQYRP
ncbi:MAG: 3'-5' exonuclease [Thermoplasmata archaeon]|nr:3'-5' exonuclease [Thermoplasmata archaeon]